MKNFNHYLLSSTWLVGSASLALFVASGVPSDSNARGTQLQQGNNVPKQATLQNAQDHDCEYSVFQSPLDPFVESCPDSFPPVEAVPDFLPVEAAPDNYPPVEAVPDFLPVEAAPDNYPPVEAVPDNSVPYPKTVHPEYVTPPPSPSHR